MCPFVVPMCRTRKTIGTSVYQASRTRPNSLVCCSRIKSNWAHVRPFEIHGWRSRGLFPAALPEQEKECTMVHADQEPNAGKAWTATELDQLRQLIDQGVPTRHIADRLGRSEYSVRAKASQARISFRGSPQPAQPPQPR